MPSDLCPLFRREVDPMNEIIRYNEVDYRVIMEIVGYLRTDH